MRKDYLHITGILSFQPKKVILQTDDGSEYFVRFRNTRTPYFHGDHVSARCTKKASAGKMAEVRIQKLLTRTKSTLIARVMGKYVQVLPLF